MSGPPVERAARWAERLGVLAALSLAFAGQIALWTWYIEDAAISFAYARNLAEGWGLVRYPGDERVEAYSNPLWVILLAGWHALGVQPFTASKYLALGLTAVAIPTTWAIGRQAGLGAAGAVLAALLLGVDAQFAIWNASGLENALFGALLALGIWRTQADAQHGRFPWAALAFLGVALTRPEGLGYAAIGGGWALVLELTGRRRIRHILGWLALFWAPFAVYHAIRYDYFGFVFPATYYAKVGDVEPQPFAWNARSWTYLRGWSLELGRGWLLPVFLAGAIGLRGWRIWAVAGLSVWLGAVLIYPGVEPLTDWGWIPAGLKAPSWWIQARVLSLAAVALGVPLLGLGAPGWRVRGLAWWLMAFALFFAVYSTGDWMRGYRWFGLAAVPLAVLLAAGCAEIATAGGRLSARWGPRAVGFAVGATVAVLAALPQVAYQRSYDPETTPGSVDQRVQHWRRAKQLLHLEHVDVLDHDMGAMLYWGVDLGIVRDARGLVDMAFALHERQVPFVREYAWEEYPFDFAHAHASTEAAVRLQGARWRNDYIEMPGYGRNNLHTANYVRKDHLVRDRWEGPEGRATDFADGVRLHGLDLPAVEVGQDSWLYLEFGLSTRPRSDAPIRLLAVLYPPDGSAPMAHDLPLGLEDWYPVGMWKEGEVFQGRVSFPVEADTDVGRYDLGLVVLGPDGVLPALQVGPDGILPETPRFAAGEVIFPGAVEVVDRRRMGQLAAEDVARSVQASAALDCDAGARWWRAARAHRVRSGDWQASNRPQVAEALAACFARRAEGEPVDAAIASLREARRWSAVHPEVFRVGRAVGDGLYAEALALQEAGDIEGAYAKFRDTLFADPARSHARRHAEELRAQRLKLRWR